MSRQWVNELKEGDRVIEFYLVKSKRRLNTRAGKPYLDIDLIDRTGLINAKVWDNAEKFAGLFERGDVIKVKGVVEDYKGTRQLRAMEVRAHEDKDGVDMGDLVKSSAQDLETMFSYILEAIESMEDEHLRALLAAFFDDRDFKDAFCKSAAARNVHHVYLGGLLEHTVKVVKLARFAAEEIYKDEVDPDLVVAGAILHDVGKVRELDSSAEIGYTSEGYLVGHIALGSFMLRERAATLPDFPEATLMELDHIILSHHGEKEWGSPVVPMTAEAIIVHNADNLDAKTQIALTTITEDPNLEEEFTQYHYTMRRHFYKGKERKEAREKAEEE